MDSLGDCSRTARKDRVPPGVISLEQGQEEQGAEEEEASVTCTDQHSGETGWIASGHHSNSL